MPTHDRVAQCPLLGVYIWSPGASGQFYTDFVKIITVSRRQLGKRQQFVVTWRERQDGVNTAAYPVAASRALSVETSPPKPVHCLFRITHSWLPVGQHFLARVPFVVLSHTNETLCKTQTWHKLKSVKIYNDLNTLWFVSFIHANAERTNSKIR